MKVRNLRGVALVLCALASVVVAQGPQRPGRGGGPDGRGAGPAGQRGAGGAVTRSIPLLQVLDKDRDGQLSAAEVSAAVAALKQLDRNGDGTLSREEIGWPPRGGFGGGFGGGPGLGGGPGNAPGGFGGRSGGGAGDMVARMLENDKNQDGKLARDELPEYLQGMMDRMDTNSDGAIDKSELEAMASRFSRGGFGGGDPRRGRPQRPQRPPLEEGE